MWKVILLDLLTIVAFAQIIETLAIVFSKVKLTTSTCMITGASIYWLIIVFIGGVPWI